MSQGGEFVGNVGLDYDVPGATPEVTVWYERYRNVVIYSTLS
jgi:hypothetical protein